MAGTTNPSQNLQSNFFWNWGNQSPDQTAGAMLDPFNITGWEPKKQMPNNPQPGMPSYVTSWDPSMAYAPLLQKELAGENLDTTGLDKFKAEALRSTPSAWAGLMDKQSYAQQAASKDSAVTQSRAGVNQAMADLASKGGLTAGAQERVARSGARDLLNVGQQNERAGNLNRMQIGINDEQNRITQLSQLPGMENTVFQDQMQKQGMYDQAYQADLGRAVQENQQRNQYNQNIYQQQMTAWAANQQANATMNSGKK